MVNQAAFPAATKTLFLMMCSALLFMASWSAQADGLPNLISVVDKNKNSVVNISTKSNGKAASRLGDLDLDGFPPQLREFFRNMPSQPRQRNFRSLGSGFIISPDGYIVTNAHVIDNADKVRVTLKDRRELDAEVIGSDEASDLALLKIKATGLPAVSLGNSDALKVGQWVIAIGAPFGLDHSASQGIVSALSRSLPDGTYVPFIQTDVAVNPGNSGGPLFDLKGNVVGVNSMIYSRSGGYMGISFSIPVNTVRNVIDQLKAKGFVSRGKLGVVIQDINQELADSFNLTSPSGALVAKVEAGSAAAKAGFKNGDVIVRYNNRPVMEASDLPPLVGATPVGKRVMVTIIRQGKQMNLPVAVGELQSKKGKEKKKTEVASNDDIFGVVVGKLNPEQRKQVRSDNGVVVNQVMGNSVASRMGIEVGDIILSFNNKDIKTGDDLKQALKSAPRGKSIPMLVIRDDAARYIAVRLPEK